MVKQCLNGEWELSLETGVRNGELEIEDGGLPTAAALTEVGKIPVSVPGSVYSGLLENGKMEDPFWRDNELGALEIMKHDFIFTRSFDMEPELLDSGCGRFLLVCEGLDTICDIELNGHFLGHTENMHRTWEFELASGKLEVESGKLGVGSDGLGSVGAGFVPARELEDVGAGLVPARECGIVGAGLVPARELEVGSEESDKDILAEKGNVLKLTFRSPTKAVAERYALIPTDGSSDAMRGYTQLRKAHCMFGWDWGPRLPDAGIWRDIYIVGIGDGEQRIDSVYVTQRHSENKAELSFQLRIKNEELRIRDKGLGIRDEELGVNDSQFSILNSQFGEVEITVTSPDNRSWKSKGEAIVIDEPMLWWPNGYGGQPLYTVEVKTKGDVWERRIGLRTITVKREKDEWGESFAFVVNGLPIFAMGADYIPQDNILSRITPRRIRELLEDCVAANYNCIRVWGGGYYQDDAFYDACDELGLVVWQDFMFACGVYELDDDFEENLRAEFVDNIKRIRHHACLGLWCGNNEMEWQYANDTFKITPKQRADYTRIFGYIIPKTLKEHDPNTFFWPSSPSSGGDFDAPDDGNRGNIHCWKVWHELAPFSDYRNYYFRFCTEFGFQSFPDIKTVREFTLPEDRNIFSRVMEMHQRNGNANGRIMFYLSGTYRYPRSFETLLYASQLLQADAVRYGVEHWRRNRGRCMGAIYWQVNDIWPVASWASIDYFGRWKALHYFAKRFFAPVMLSCHETGEMTERPSPVSQREPIKKAARFSLANETREAVSGKVMWALRDPMARVIKSGEMSVRAEAFSSSWLDEIDFSDCDELSNYVSFEFVPEGQAGSAGAGAAGAALSGTALFCMPKHFNFADPKLSVQVSGSSVTVSAAAYAKSVELYSDVEDFVLSDNFFDMNAGSATVQILRGSAKEIKARSVYDI